jgi:hypothetical protein
MEGPGEEDERIAVEEKEEDIQEVPLRVRMSYSGFSE